MTTRFVQALVLAAFCFIPSTALADGLLGSVTEKVTSTVKETVPLQRSGESTNQSGQQNKDHAEQKDASLLGTVADAAEETVKRVTKPVIIVDNGKEENAKEESLVNVNLSEDPSITLDAKIAEASVSDSISVKTPVADAEVGDSIKVATPVADVEVSDSISVKTPVADAEVGDSIKVKTPVADVDVSDSISVKTPVADAEVGDSIKVKTPVADVDVSDSISVKTPVADAEAGESIKVKTPSDKDRTDSISIKTPAETDIPDDKATSDTPSEPTARPDINLDDTSVESDDDLIDELSQAGSVKPLPAGPLEKSFDPADKAETAALSDSGNKAQDKGTEQTPAEKPVQAAIAYVPANSGTNSSGATASGGQSAPGGAALPSIYFAGVPMIDAMSEKAARYGNVAFFHDQWLNAPPSQPPQSSFFSHVFI